MEEDLISILNDVREKKFPEAFKSRTTEGKLILEMLSVDPDKRPTIGTIIDTIKEVNDIASQGNKC